MTHFIRMLAIGLALVSGAMLMGITTLMFFDVIGRYVFSAPLTYSVEMVELMMGLAITFGLALTTLRREHIRVDLLSHALPPLFKRALDLLADVATLVFMALVSWKLLGKAGQSMGDGTYTQILGVPVYPVVYLMSFAAAAALAVAIWLLVQPKAGDGTGPDVMGD